MAEFFEAQIDYIVFFYGLAFIILAATCLTLAKGRDRRLPWVWFGLFGITRGVSEWMDLLAFSLGDSPLFVASQSILLALSFTFLVEFGRDGLVRLTGKGPPRWVLLPLLVLAAWAAQIDALWPNLMERYTLGLFGGLLAALVLRIAADRAPRPCSLWLRATSALVAAYAVVAGAVVPKGDFFPASLINEQTFPEAFGIPVQLVRGILAVLVAVAVTAYSDALLVAEASADEPRQTPRTNMWRGLALLAVIVGGWALTRTMGDAGDTFCRRNLLRRAVTAASAIDPSLLAGLTGSRADIGSEQYRRLRNQLRTIGLTNSDCRFVYLMGRGDGKVIFLVDAEPENSNDYSAPGDGYDEATPELLRLFSGGKAFVEGPLTDSWGSWVSGLAPVPEARMNGSAVILGMDVDAQDWLRSVGAYRLFCIVVTLLVCVLILTFFYVLQSARDTNRKLAASESRYRSVVEGSPNWVSLLDLQGQCVGINRAGLETVDRTEDEILGQRFVELWPDEYWESVETALEKAREGSTSSLEADYVRQDGQRTSLQVSVGPVAADDGRIRRLVALASDITQRKRAEQALRESEEKYRNVVERANDGIAIFQDDTIVFANRRFAEMAGYTVVEMTGMPIGDYAELCGVPVLAERYTKRMAGEDVPAVYDSAIISKDGGRLDVEVNAGIISYQGRPADLVLFRNITERKRIEEAVERSRDSYLSLFEEFPALIWRSGADGKCDYFNGTWLAFTGRTIEQESGGGWIEGIHPDDIKRRMTTYFQAFKSRQPFELEYRLQRHDGEYRWIIDRGAPINDVDGKFMGYVGSCFDITDMKHAESNMRMHTSAMNAAGDQIVITDPDGRIEFVNLAFERETGYGSEEVIGKKPSVLKSGEHDAAFYDELWNTIRSGRTWQGEIVNRRKDGGLYTEDMTITPVKNESGEIERFIAIKRNITEKKVYEKQLDRLAHYDHLTGLPNRLLFADRLTQNLAKARRNGESLAVMFLDLDRFKNINDTLGHSIGDILLNGVARRLTACLREMDTVARMGGDEFTIILSQISQPDDATNVAQKILDSLAKPFDVGGGYELFVSASIGITMFPLDGSDVETLVKNADTAMYRAKEQGRNNWQLCTSATNAAALQRMELETSLRRAVDREELLAHYQPRVDLSTGRIVGTEALLRWQHPELGLVSPAEFIPLAEDTGLIIPIGEWALREACAQNKAWQDSGLPKMPVAVNLSPRQFRQKDLVEIVAGILKETGLDPKYLELEVTESAIMHKPSVAAAALRRLKDMGVQVSIDDFGAGQSSLSYLKRFPIDTLKIDQSFIRDITTDPDDAAIARAIVAMAHSLKLNVIAEGVETLEQLQFLRSLDCDEVQGYFISRPVPAEEFARQVWEADNLRSTGILPAA
ncbi:MAG: EAL domain-containing protein [Armatimonadota bacterium]|nr:EAL domain-containing protein [Armatimonadota bacterium]